MRNRFSLRYLWVGCLSLFIVTAADAQPAVTKLARQSQQRVVKVYGAGGLSGLESYQSGLLVSPAGHVATAWSYVLDVDPVVILDDGRRFEAKVVGFEPALEMAVLKIEASSLPYFPLDADVSAQWGEPILAVSNLFGIATGNEPASVMQGSIAAITNLDAGRGNLKSAYDGEVLVLDLVANNPGAAGGAVVDWDGRLLGMLGKELRDAETGVWLNYALPVKALRQSLGDIIAGRDVVKPPSTDPALEPDQAHSTATLGLVMIPDVLEKTPAYVDAIAAKSPAATARVRPDDLILLVDGQRVENQRALAEVLRRVDRRDAVQITVQRGTEIIPLTLRP